MRSLKTPGSLQINLLFTMYAEHASSPKADAKPLFLQKTLTVSLDTNRFGGAERDRTADPLLAKQVLSQLCYSPISSIAPNFFEVRQLPRHRSFPAAPCVAKRRSMVGPGRLELPTPRLSSVCSNQLSYGPILVKPVQTTQKLSGSTRFFVFLKKEKRGRRGSPYHQDLKSL